MVMLYGYYRRDCIWGLLLCSCSLHMWWHLTGTRPFSKLPKRRLVILIYPPYTYVYSYGDKMMPGMHYVWHLLGKNILRHFSEQKYVALKTTPLET